MNIASETSTCNPSTPEIAEGTPFAATYAVDAIRIPELVAKSNLYWGTKILFGLLWFRSRWGEGQCNRMLQDLARDLHVSPATVTIWWQQLADAGLVYQGHQVNSGTHQVKTTRVDLDHPWLKDSDPEQTVYVPEHVIGLVPWNAAAVAGAIAHVCGHQGWCRRTYRYLGEMVGLNREIVKRAIRELLAQGFIKVWEAAKKKVGQLITFVWHQVITQCLRVGVGGKTNEFVLVRDKWGHFVREDQIREEDRVQEEEPGEVTSLAPGPEDADGVAGVGEEQEEEEGFAPEGEGEAKLADGFTYTEGVFFSNGGSEAKSSTAPIDRSDTGTVPTRASARGELAPDFLPGEEKKVFTLPRGPAGVNAFFGGGCPQGGKRGGGVLREGYWWGLWKEELRAKFGEGYYVAKWEKRQRYLLGRLVREFGSEELEAMIKDFVRGWNWAGEVPSLGLLWVRRERQVARARGQVRGQVGTKARWLEGEWDEELAARDEGWGDGEGEGGAEGVQRVALAEGSAGGAAVEEVEAEARAVVAGRVREVDKGELRSLLRGYGARVGLVTGADRRAAEYLLTRVSYAGAELVVGLLFELWPGVAEQHGVKGVANLGVLLAYPGLVVQLLWYWLRREAVGRLEGWRGAAGRQGRVGGAPVGLRQWYLAVRRACGEVVVPWYEGVWRDLARCWDEELGLVPGASELRH